MANTTASRALERRIKNRKLPGLNIPQTGNVEVDRALLQVREYLQLYEGDRGAPKERFVTIDELEQAGILTTSVRQGLAVIDTVLGDTVSNTKKTSSAGGSTGSSSASVGVSGPIKETQIIDGLLLARVADNETITGTWTYNVEDVGGALSLNSTSFNFDVYVDETSGLFSGGLMLKAADGWNTEYGMYFDGGGLVATVIPAAAYTMAGAAPAAGDDYESDFAWMTDAAFYLAQCGFYGDDFFQFGSLVQDGPYGFYVTETGFTYVYPLLVDTANAATYFPQYAVRIGSDGGTWSRGAGVGFPTIFVEFDHDGADFNIAGTNTTDINVSGITAFNLMAGASFHIFDSGGTDQVSMSHDGADFNFQFTNTTNVDFQGMTNVRLLAGGVFKIYDSSSSDQIQISHGGVDALFNFTNTTDCDFTGLSSGALTCDGDFRGGKLYLAERSASAVGLAGYGHFWVSNNAAGNVPWFTDDVGNQYPLGYGEYRVYANQSDTVDGGYISAAWYSDNATAYTLTLEASTSTEFPINAQFTVWNEGSGTLTINEGTGDTLYVLTGSAVTDSAGGCTIGQGGYATVIRKSASVWLIMGAGITP